MPRFSIIVPIYKAEAYLHECIISVLQQTYQDFELILVDDGSPDNCLIMCNRFAAEDQRIRAIHQANSGVSAARNTGINMASGDYLLFLDSDDFWNSSELLAELNKQPEADVILFSCIDWETSSDSCHYPRTEYDLSMFRTKPKEDILCSLFKKRLFPGGAVVAAVKRKFVEEWQLRFDPTIRVGEDYDWLFRVFLTAERYGAVNLPYYTYRRHGGTLSTSVNAESVRWLMCIVDKWGRYSREQLSGELKWEFTNYLAHIYSTGFIFCGNMVLQERKKALEYMEPYRDILDEVYWKQLLLVKWCRKILGANLTSILMKYYFNMTHRRRQK